MAARLHKHGRAVLSTLAAAIRYCCKVFACENGMSTHMNLKNDHLNFRRANGAGVGLVMLCLLVLAGLLNWQENRLELVPPLAVAGLTAIVTLVWLKLEKNTFLPPMLLLNVSLALLGIYLLTVQGAPAASSLFWFIIYPPMVMFSLGLRWGTVIFLSYFGALVLLLLTPFEIWLATDIHQEERYRFLLAMFGSFIFAWAAEYAGYNTREALARTLERLETEAKTDPLTGLGNRRDFQNSFAWVLAQSARKNKSFGLLLIDLDHFKKVNDDYGHEIGDKMLCHVANALSNQIRATDRVFRWGGEEFITLMPDSDIETIHLVAERMRSHAEANPFVFGGLVIPYTISIGLYCGNNDNGEDDQDGPLLKADRNLYTAKGSGRNRVVG